jgi:RNA polymerase sigma-70 factor, ECF subfamily
MSDRAERGLAIIDELEQGGDLDNYHLLHAARADLLRRLGAHKDAAVGYKRALDLVSNETERRFLERRLSEVLSAGNEQVPK